MAEPSSQKIVEDVKARLLEEGREARNLVAFSVPVPGRKNSSHSESRIKAVSKDLKKLSVEVPTTHKPEKRPRSASAGRDPQASLRARHWGFLFRNLEQAVDEIYQTCEDDDSVIECKESILILERYTNDFYKLIEWLHLKWAYENTPPPQRPHSLSWEIRTSSPSKRSLKQRKNLSLFGARKARMKETEKLTTQNLELHNAVSEDKNFRETRAEDSAQKSDGKSSKKDNSTLTTVKEDCDESSTKSPNIKLPSKAPETTQLCDIPEHATQKTMVKSPNLTRKKTLCKNTKQSKDLKPESVAVKSDVVATSLENFLTTSASESHINKDESRLRLSGDHVRSKSAINLKAPSKINESEGKKLSLDSARGSNLKSAPTVNMNKASQVRQAYNQSKTPQKSPRSATQKTPATTQHDAKIIPKQGHLKSSMKKSLDLNPHKKKTENTNQTSKSNSEKNRSLTRSATTLEESQVRHPAFNNRTASLIVDDIKQSRDNFSSNCSLASTSSSGLSWADKVKGASKSHGEPESQMSLPDKDNEGWEIVRRGRRSGSSASLSSPSSKSHLASVKGHKFKIQNRFNQPTSAVSMPSLAVQPKDEIERKGSLKKTSHQDHAPHNKRRVKNEEKINKDRSNHCTKLEDTKTKLASEEFNLINSVELNSHSHCDDSGSESDREEEEMSKNEAAWQTAVKEEQRLNKEIEEEERNPFEGLVEDDTEVSSEGTSTLQAEDDQQKEPINEWNLSSTTLNWAEQMDFLDTSLEVARSPGRVLHIHEKLSSPSRKLSISQKEKKHLNRLAKAQELRGRLIHEKTEKLHDLFKKIDDVHSEKDRLLMQKRAIFERKMARAEEKRNGYLQKIVTKAHDEENKAKEIAFINGLEAQNKLHDILQQQQSHESRLADMAEERCRKQEEKAAKEAAAQERRKVIESDRQARMAELCEKRRQRCERIERLQAERREELLEQAREKARDREERLNAMQQAQQAKESELVKKIQHKQEETARRHEENIEIIRHKALESSIARCSRGCDDAPKLLRYETKKLCTLCNALIASEVYLLSHLRGQQHQEGLRDLYKEELSNEQAVIYNLKHIIDAPESIDDPQVTKDKERQKALKKRCRKIRARMISKGKEFVEHFEHASPLDIPTKGRMAKGIQQVYKLLTSQGSGPWSQADVAVLDRNLLDLLRILDKSNGAEQMNFGSLNGFSRLSDLLALITAQGECVVPPKSLGYCVQVLVRVCRRCPANCLYVLESNMVGSVVDHIMRRLADLSTEVMKIGTSNSSSLATDPAVSGLMELLETVLEVLVDHIPENKVRGEAIWLRIQDVVSYSVSVGVLDKVTWYFNRVQSPVDNDQPSTEFILSAMKLLSSLTRTLIGKSDQDPTQLMGTIQVTEAYGVVSLLYGLLLHQAGRSTTPPPVDHLSVSTLSITEASTTLLHNIAQLDLQLFQGIMGSEGISLELRHICSFLLWYCSHWPSEQILHNIITLVGFFTVENKENQSIVQSGETPSVLQQLCSLPWKYFSDAKLTAILFPTLLACCLGKPDNINIVAQEMSTQVLEDFLNQKMASHKTLVQIIQKSWAKNPQLMNCG